MNNVINVEIKLLHANFKNNIWNLPNYATEGSAAFDLLAAIDAPITIPPFNTSFVSTGLSIWIKDPNFVLLMAPRSGKGCKNGIVLGNTVGVIDSDYQGPLIMCIYNRTKNEITITPGEYIAQALIIEKYHMKYSVVKEFSNLTIRGKNGFGSTK